MKRQDTPLAGVRVLELGRLIAAPFCSQILGDLGADIIKVEQVGTGDDIRAYGPPFLRNEASSGSATPYYLAYNRNKRSVAIDFSRPEGAQLVRDLAAKSDVFIENFKVGSLKKYALDETSIRKVHDRIIYLSVSGFGQSGPYAHRPATDVVVQGISGLMSVTGEPDGPPNKVGVSIADMVTGLYGAVAIISSLYQRAATASRGQWVGVSLLDSVMSIMDATAIWSYLQGQPPSRLGNRGLGSAPSGVFACRDGQILIQAGKDADFVKLCGAIDLGRLAEDPRFARRANRVMNVEQLHAILDPAIAGWSVAALYSTLVGAGVISGPVNSIDQALSDAQVVASGLQHLAGHPDDPELKLIASPIRFRNQALEIRSHPPRLGEHTASVLRDELGLDMNTIARLAREGVVELFAEPSASLLSSG